MKRQLKKLCFTLIYAAILTGFISFTLTLINSNGYSFPLTTWLRSWSIAFMIVVLFSFFLPKIVQIIINKLFN